MAATLAATQVALLIFMVALQGSARPNAGIVNVVFPPWTDIADDERRIVEAGGRPVGKPVWGFVFKVAVKDGVVDRIARHGAILAFMADRRSICSSPVARA